MFISSEEYRRLKAAERRLNKVLDENQDLLSDFSYTLATAIEDELQHLNEPVFTNPITGHSASSLYGIVKAMGGALGVHPLRRTFAPLRGDAIAPLGGRYTCPEEGEVYFTPEDRWGRLALV